MLLGAAALSELRLPIWSGTDKSLTGATASS